MTPQKTILEAVPELSPEQAQRIVDALYPRLVSAQVVHETFGPSRDWVYDNSARLGARRLGTGPKAHKGFVLHEVRAALDGMMETASPDEPAVSTEPRQRRKPRETTQKDGFTPAGAPLLKYKRA